MSFIRHKYDAESWNRQAVDNVKLGMWKPINQAAEELSLTRRSVERRIQTGKIPSKKEGGQRLVWISTETASSDTDVVLDELRAEVETLKQDLRSEREQRDEERKRHDIIIMRLADQTESQRLQLEEAQQPKPLLSRLRAVFAPN